MKKKFNIEKYTKNVIEKILNERIYENKNIYHLHKKLFYLNKEEKIFSTIPKRNIKNIKNNFCIGLLYSSDLTEYYDNINDNNTSKDFFLNFLKKKCKWFNDKKILLQEINNKDLQYLIFKNSNYVIILSLFEEDEEYCNINFGGNFEKFFGFYYYNDICFPNDDETYIKNFLNKNNIENYYFKILKQNVFLSLFKNNFSFFRKKYIIKLLSYLNNFLENPEKLIHFFSYNFKEKFLCIINLKTNEEHFLYKRCVWETLYFKTNNFKFVYNKLNIFPNFILFFNKKINLDISDKSKISCDFINQFYLNKKFNFYKNKNSSLNCYFIENYKINFFDFFKLKNIFFMISFLRNSYLSSYKTKMEINFPYFISITFDFLNFFDYIYSSNKKEIVNKITLLYNNNFEFYPYRIIISVPISEKDFIKNKNSSQELILIHNDKLKNFKNSIKNKKTTNNHDFLIDDVFYNKKIEDFSYYTKRKSNFTYLSNFYGPSTIRINKKGSSFIPINYTFHYNFLYINEYDFIDFFKSKLSKITQLDKKINFIKNIFKYFI